MTRDLKQKLLAGEAIDRREFTSASLMALLAGVTVSVAGCSSDGNGNPMNPSNPGSGDKVGSISANHSHSATITSAQLMAGQAITLNIGDQADHPHTVQISMADLTAIAAGTQVSKTSSQDTSATFGPHSHVVTFN